MADEAVDLTIECAGVINGQLITAQGKGLGSAQRGSMAANYNFSAVPAGYSVFCAALWTSCCSTPAFAIEQDGGVNMITLSKARYHCIRTFDFGTLGKYDYTYDIRLEGQAMKAVGCITGVVNLPSLTGVDLSLIEIMAPIGDREVRSFLSASFIATDGRKIPVQVSGRYTPLEEDHDANWSGRIKNQVRRSILTNIKSDATSLSLEYFTVIKAIEAPEFPASLPLVYAVS